MSTRKEFGMWRPVPVAAARLASLALVVAFAALVSGPSAARGQVLGACGTPSENEAPAAPQEMTAAPMSNAHMPLPGDRAINFELPAVVGDEIEMIKLSDYNGSWRVVCFYPADFTFV
ncbi:MAG: redoxin domain-containing protein [Candidatus Eisenbacteria bacterium]|nr:redoxin domain-containing protein [Candidatus Eisenbacteria bacterium]